MLSRLPLRSRSFIFSLLGGCLYALGFPNHFVPILIVGPIFGLALLFHHLDLSGRRNLGLYDKALALLGFSLGHAALGFYWIPHTLQEFGGLTAPWNYLVGSLFSLIVVPQLWVFLFASHWFNRRAKVHFPSWARHVFFAIVLTTLENVVPQQFPGHPGHSWLDMAPYLGLAPVGGAPLFSFFSYWLAQCVCQPIKERQDWWGVALGLFFVIINALTPLSFNHDQAGETLNIRLIQPNIGNFLKLDSERGGRTSVSQVLNDYEDMSTADGEGLDLIIWPETAYPHLLRSNSMSVNRTWVPTVFKDIMAQTGAELLVGGYDQNMRASSSFMSQYNAAFHFDRDDGLLKQVYRKHLLIPFGEGLPFGPFNESLSRINTNVSFFAAGETFPLFQTAKDFSFATIICYETLFPIFVRAYLEELRQLGKRPDFLLNLTNDSWYGDTMEPFQHLFLAKWRAIEFNLPMVRSTNTGISSVVYPDGSESPRTGVNEKTNLEVKLHRHQVAATPYQRYGLLVTWAIFVALSAMMYGASALARKTFAHQIVKRQHPDENS